MKARWLGKFVFVLCLALIIVLSPGGTLPARAQGPLPPAPPDPRGIGGAGSTYQTKDGLWVVSGQPQPNAPTRSKSPQATGGPDQFGYTWNDSVAFSWIDATAGTKTGLNGTYQFTSLSLPFNFKYYENSYSTLYISTHGTIGFDNSISSRGQQNGIPNPTIPNNVIAAYWSPENASTGGVYYLSGGVAPNRWVAVEWYQVRDYIAGSRLTFETVIYENGNILFQYQTMNYAGSTWWATSIGIEDSQGTDGILYSIERQSSSKAVQFTRPAPAARASITPSNQGRFTHANTIESLKVAIRNIGDLGTDTFSLTPSSTWATSVYAADGVTPASSTGPLAPGSTFTAIVKITVPGAATTGSSNTATLVARSGLDNTKSRSTSLQLAVPAPFAQVYDDGADGAMSLYLAQPPGQAVKKTTAYNYYGFNPSVAEAPNGNFIYAWYKGRCFGNPCNIYVNDIEYTILDRFGSTVRGVTKLTDNSGATVSTYDSSPAVAIAPNGQVGLLWSRQLYNSSNQFNYNLYFAILDSGGNLAYGPANLTNNTVWATGSDLNVPSFYYPRISATGDNRFVMAWVRDDQVSSGSYMDNIYYAVRDSLGNGILGITQLTNATPGVTAYYFPSLAALSSNRAFLSWSSRPSQQNGTINYSIIGSDGTIIKPATLLSDSTMQDWTNADAVQLSDGKILAAWQAWGCFGGEWAPRVRYALLDTSYNRIGTPTCLAQAPSTAGGDGNISVTSDANMHGILTWTDNSNNFNLYYALVDSGGSTPTQPMIYQSSQTFGFKFSTSWQGYGNTTYTTSGLPPGVANWLQVGNAPAPSYAPVRAAGQAAVNRPIILAPATSTVPIPIERGNHGLTTATSVVLTATLASGLTYSSDTSGVTPTVIGNLATWNLPDMNFLTDLKFNLFVNVPSAPDGTHFTVGVGLNASGASPQYTSGDVVINGPMFLPHIEKSP